MRVINNCALQNGDAELGCQICGGRCPLRDSPPVDAPFEIVDKKAWDDLKTEIAETGQEPRLTMSPSALLAVIEATRREERERGLPDRVRAFHHRFGHPVRHVPKVPSEEEVRFRMALLIEEFVELLASVFGGGIDPERREEMDRALRALENLPIRANLPELADALADLDYVIEGTRAVFGIDGEPIAAAVHAANMAKEPNGSDKPTKPTGWKPPDIGALLIEQGWEPLLADYQRDGMIVVGGTPHLFDCGKVRAESECTCGSEPAERAPVERALDDYVPDDWRDVFDHFGTEGLLKLGFEPAIVQKLAELRAKERA